MKPELNKLLRVGWTFAGIQALAAMTMTYLGIWVDPRFGQTAHMHGAMSATAALVLTVSTFLYVIDR